MKKILISGASIAGPTLAYWLRQYGFEPAIVERAPEPRYGGYKVDIRGVAVDVVERMGLLPDVRRVSTDMQGTTHVDRDNKELATMPADFFAGREGHDDEVQRGELTRILYDATKGDVEYLFGDSITGITEQQDGVLVTFERSEPRVFDMVIGADGLHSNVRGLVFGEESRFIKHLGSYISFFSTDHHMDLDRWELMHTMPGKSVCLYRAGNDPTAKAWFIFSSEELDYDRRDLDRQRRILAEKFAGEGWEIPRLIESMNSSPDFYFDSMAQIHMDSWSKGRTALVGDAGYCASPASGQGTALALVGAYVLAGEIMAAEGDHTVAFPGYERKMREFVRKNQVFGQKAVKQFARGRLMVWLQAKMIRMLPHLPWKNLVIGGILDEIKAAANGITLESYDGR